MKAWIKPLDGKYYGTIIVIQDGQHRTSIEIWCNADFEPSDRELDLWRCTRQEWDENILIDNGWGGKSPIKEFAICDSHFESDWTYKLAQKIVKFLNEGGYCAKSK